MDNEKRSKTPRLGVLFLTVILAAMVPLGAAIGVGAIKARYNLTGDYSVDECLEKLNHSEMFDYDNKDRVQAAGYYFDVGYYCVWTGDGTEKAYSVHNIEYYDKHEFCHALVNESYDHFCKEVDE